MSRAFVKEGDGEAADGDLPERQQSDHPNYVTRRGLERLRAEVRRLDQERRALEGDDSLGVQHLRKEVERDLRYFTARVGSAQLVERDPASRQVGIGATVAVVDDRGTAARYAIVGEDEADVAHGLVSWSSPLARALLGAEVGDAVIWQRPDGARELEITAIEALEPPA